MVSDPNLPVARWDGDDLVIRVKVVAGAQADEISIEDTCVKVRIKALPIDGKANRYLKKFLGKTLGAPQSGITIERGASQTIKTVRVPAPKKRLVGLKIA